MRATLTEVQLLREVVQKVVPMIAGRGVRVTQQGAQAFVQHDPRTKKIVRVNIPHVPDDADSKLVLAIHGFIDHECGHVLDTDWEAVGDGARVGREIAAEQKISPSTVVARIQSLANIVEDTYVEACMRRRFPGTALNLDRLYDVFLARITEPALKAATNDAERFGVLAVPLVRSLAGQRRFTDWLDTNKYMDDPLVKAFVDRLTPTLRKELLSIKNSWDSLDIATQFYHIIYPAPPPPPPAPPPPPKSDMADAITEEMKADEPEEETEPGDGTGSSDKPEEEDDKGSDGDEAETPPEAETPETPESPADAEKEPEGDEGSDDEDDAASDAPEPAADPTDEPEDDDLGDDAEDDPETGSDEAESDEEPDDDGDAESDEEVEDGSGSAPDAEKGEDDDKADAEKTGAGKPDETPKDEDPDAKSAPTVTPEPSPFEDAEVPEAKDLSEAIGDLISEEAAEAVRGADYHVFTTEWDKIEPVDINAGMKYNPAWMKALDDVTRHMVSPMQKEIERIMAARSQVVKVPGFRSGRLHGGSLHRLRINDDRVFRRKQENHSTETAVSLLVDNSGSMGHREGGKTQTAMAAAYALSQTLERVGIRHEVIGFTTGDMTHEQVLAVQAEEARIGAKFARSEPLYMPIYKGYDERLTTDTRSRFAKAYGYAHYLSQNIDGECVAIAGDRLLRQRETRRVLLVLSDGEPSCCTGSRRDLDAHLKKTVKDLTKKGVETVGIGIQSSEVSKYYPRHLVLTNIADLPKAVMGELKRILLNPNK